MTKNLAQKETRVERLDWLRLSLRGHSWLGRVYPFFGSFCPRICEINIIFNILEKKISLSE